MKYVKLSYLILLFSIYLSGLFGVTASAQSSGRAMNFRTAKVGLVYETYAGIKYKSLAEGNPGYGVELSVDAGGKYFRYFVRARGSLSDGYQTFLDAGVPVRSSYRLTQMSPELGLSLYPVSRRDKGLNLYLWGTAIVSYNLLEMIPLSTTSSTGSTTPVTSYTSLRPRDQGVGYGLGGGIGFELFVGRSRRSGGFAVYGEMGFREQQAQLANLNNFQLQSLGFTLGFGF